MALRQPQEVKKNDMMSQQIANSLKMSAYLNKNTFSSSTALPPEENRLNMKDIVSKGANPIWLRREGEEGVEPTTKVPARRTGYSEDMQNGGADASCQKCGQGIYKLFS